VLVSDYYDLPDCNTYQGAGAGADSGRACVPEKGASQVSVFRATNYPSGAVNPKNPNQVTVTFGSYINQHSNESNGCVPAGFAGSGINIYTGVKTPGACNNDIVLSVSNNGGASFTGGSENVRAEETVNQDAGQATTDQWFQWAAFTKDGKLAVDYYDRQYGQDEFNAWSDFSLSGSKNLSTFGTKRVTSSSMPPRHSSEARTAVSSTGTTSGWARQATTRCRSGPTPVTSTCSSAPGPVRRRPRRVSAPVRRTPGYRRTTRTRTQHAWGPGQVDGIDYAASVWGRASGPTRL
jgi:hypothetical protein